MSDEREYNRQLDKVIERNRVRNEYIYSQMGPHGRSGARALCAVAGVVIGAFSFTKSDFFLAPVLGAVAGLCIGWFIGWCLSRTWEFLTVFLPRGIRYLCHRLFGLRY